MLTPPLSGDRPIGKKIAAVTSETFAHAGWAKVLPWYEELVSRALDAPSLPEWLADWSALESALAEAAALAMIAYTCDTENETKLGTHLRFSGEILPKAEEQSVKLARRFVELGLVPAGLEQSVARFRRGIEVFREANVPLSAQSETLGSEYQQITGGLTAMWKGEELPLPRLAPLLKSTDRGEREQAFRLWAAPYVARRGELTALFDKMFALRQQMARNAGFKDFEGYTFAAKCRFDYTPDDCRRFHDSIEQTVVPAVERIYERRRARLGLGVLRPWDTHVDPAGRAAIRPFQTEAEFVGTAERVFQRINPVLGTQFATMEREHLLDLTSRKGKAPGGYCETLSARGRPFIFMNAAGTVEDVMTLLHEAGHAFHAFATHPLPYLWQRAPTMEMAELASMSMELLAFSALKREDGGFFGAEEYHRAKREHLEDALLTLAHVASVDAFQSWIYTSGEGGDAAARDNAWLRIRGRFERGVDWSGLESERVARWYRQLHIFLYPFYYIEYGLAGLGALQVWRNALQNHPAALANYRQALALGGTRSLPELYQTAGARLVFDAKGMGELVALVEGELARMEETDPSR
ncbi:MAG: M3 family oligoendopeptidase [Gemmatimonadales bacterium]